MKDQRLLVGGAVLAVLLLVLATAGQTPPSYNTVKTPRGEESAPATFSDPLVEEACNVYYTDLLVNKPKSPPPYDCVLGCEGNLLGWCPEEEYIYVCLKERVKGPEVTPLYRSARALYRSLRSGEPFDVNTELGTRTTNYYLSLTTLYPYLQRFVEEKNTFFICAGIDKSLRKA